MLVNLTIYNKIIEEINQYYTLKFYYMKNINIKYIALYILKKMR